MVMKIHAAQVLQRIAGLPLWSVGRAGDLEWFAFGNERRVITQRDGSSKTVSDYSLHVQCAWRIRRHSTILLASRDRFYPSGDDPYASVLEFEWDKPGANQLDERVSRILEGQGVLPLTVGEVDADETGSFCLTMNQEYFLEIFPDNSITKEYWRLFRPYSEEEHFVFTNEGIQSE